MYIIVFDGVLDIIDIVIGCVFICNMHMTNLIDVLYLIIFGINCVGPFCEFYNRC